MTASDTAIVNDSNNPPSPHSRNGTSSLPERPKSRTMPNYYHSSEASNVKKLRRNQEKEITEQLLAVREEKKLHVLDLQNEAKKAMIKVPLDILTTDWFVTTIDTVELRSYLVDKVLPQVVLGLEKLLIEADRRGLPYVAQRKAAKSDIEKDPEKEIELQKIEAIIGEKSRRPEDEPSYDPNFNPLNYLARYLMRNNPRYNNHSEFSPYCRGLRVISHQLKQKVYSTEENKLAGIKFEAKKKREEREQRERYRLEELARKETNLSNLFPKWIYPSDSMPPKHERDPNELIQLAYVQNALRSFEEMVQKLPSEMQKNAKFDIEIDQTDCTGRTLDKYQFQKFLMKYVHAFSTDMFDLFVSHLEMCANAYHEVQRVSRRQKIYNDLFNFLDTNIGYINRKTIIKLLEKFWFRCGKEKRTLLRDPRKWPIVEIHEGDEEAGEPVDDNEESVATEGEVEGSQKGAEEETEGPGESSEETANEADTVEDDENQQSLKQEQTEEEQPQPEVEQEEPTQQPQASEPDQSEPQTDQQPDGATYEVAEEVETVEGEGEGGVTETEKAEDEELGVGDGGEDEATGGDDDIEVDNEKDETASIKEERNIIQEIKDAQLEKEKTDKLQEVIPKETVEPFYDDMLSCDQFSLLIKNFLGERCEDKLLYSFISYIRDYYIEHEQDKLVRITKLNSNVKEKFNRFIVDALFNTWDSDKKGFIELPEFISVAEKYKDGAEQEALDLGLDKLGTVAENRLTQSLFVELIEAISQHLTDGEEQLQAYVQFLNDSVDKSHEEKIRGLARKKWLDEITAAAQVTGDMEAVYRAVFNALYKDAEAHGRNKKISANICLLESNPAAHPDAPDIPTKILRCVASTVEDAPFTVGMHITHLVPNVSFPAMSQKELIHVPKVKSHGSVHYWNSRRSDKDGSLVVCPIMDMKRNVYATLSIDTLRTQNRENRVFLQHELAFFQGVTQKFNDAYALIDVKRKSLKIVESCIKWIKLNCPSVRECTFFLVEYNPDEKATPFTLRMMLGSDYQGFVTYFSKSKALALQDNMFKEYLYKSVSNSETVIGELLGQFHMACPIRDLQGFTRSILDINLGSNLLLNKMEKIDLLRMLKIQQDSFSYMSAEAEGKATEVGLEIEEEMGGSSVEILFEKMMLLEMRKAVSEISGETFAEIKSYNQPPEIIIQLVDILIEMFLARSKDQLSQWNSKKLVLSIEMLKKVAAFDPTAPTTLDPNFLRNMINEISKEKLSTMGPFPAQTLYNWLTVTVSLMEHANNFRVTTAENNKKKPLAQQQQHLRDVATEEKEVKHEEMAMALNEKEEMAQDANDYEQADD